MRGRYILGVIGVGAVLAAGVAAYFAVRAAWDGGPAPTVVTEPTVEATPITMRPGRGISAKWTEDVNEDARKPRFEGVVNGIVVGPDVEEGGLEACLHSNARYLSAEDLAGTEYDLNPAYLPKGVEFVGGEATMCGEMLVYLEKEYWVPEKRDAEGLVLWYGGSFRIRRILIANDRIQMNAAAERMGPITIKGRVGILERPVLPEGVDGGLVSMTVVLKETVGFTILQGGGLPFAEFIKIADSLYPEP